MREVWLAQQNADMAEGRGPMVTQGAFLHREHAERCARQLIGVMGIGHGEVDPTPMKVYDTFEEWERNTTEGLRQRALNKLTTEERQALGL